jgi:hypothetical protein
MHRIETVESIAQSNDLKTDEVLLIAEKDTCRAERVKTMKCWTFRSSVNGSLEAVISSQPHCAIAQTRVSVSSLFPRPDGNGSYDRGKVAVRQR